MAIRRTRSGQPERRDHTPPGRLRRISHDYRSAVWTLAAAVVLVAVLFVATAAWAVNARFERDVAEIAYTHDHQELAFLAQRETRGVAELRDTVQALARRVDARTSARSPYLVVSLAEREVYYIDGGDTVFTAPVAIGSGATIVIGGQTKRFQTPRGHLRIIAKEKDPIWVPPNWYYVQYARDHGLRLVDMSDAAPNALAGYPAGQVPVSNGTVYIPPWGSPQRRYKGVLGVAKLAMRDGYYFHGTDNPNSVGTAASHGCLRMHKDDILWMYAHVPVGTDVYIY
ncbi:MAG TPA: L,D-transpeptidase [Longimicrobiaceae bacterium]|nr:L,D-transpeptidase [Longimicrobiaceae bacterium]